MRERVVKEDGVPRFVLLIFLYYLLALHERDIILENVEMVVLMGWVMCQAPNNVFYAVAGYAEKVLKSMDKWVQYINNPKIM